MYFLLSKNIFISFDNDDYYEVLNFIKDFVVK